MNSLDAPFLATLGATVTRPLVLVEIAFSAVLRLSSADDLSWNGHVWIGGRLLGVAGLGQDAAGQSRPSLKLDNTDQVMEALVLNERYRNRAVSIWEAWLDATGQPHVKLALAGHGGQATVGSGEMVAEVIGGRADLTRAPRETIRHAVGWPPPKPQHYATTWNGQVYTVGGRGA